MAADIVVPEMGESIVDARVAKWFKKEGDAVVVGEPLVELETDKVDIEVAAPQSGVLGKIAFAQGSDVKIGDVLGSVAEGSGAVAGGSGAAAERSVKADSPSVAATPSARKAARESKIDIASVATRPFQWPPACRPW